ncbi:MAG TPA: hypothetical protein PKV98_07745 [Burkholderiaceae bacterium]|nr:hypothetical protein [Burkholderiaceae bacterium]
MATKVYTGDTGTVITLDCGQDISAATARAILVRKPDGTTTSWTASASGTDAIAYTTLAGTLDQDGIWKLQSYITLPSGARKGETANLAVYSAFQ